MGFAPRYAPYSYKGFPKWVQALETGPKGKLIFLGVASACVIAQIGLSATIATSNLPATMTPENEAKHVAWMKFNNVNPIFGMSIILWLPLCL